MLNDKPVKLLVDTGCPVTLISEKEGLMLETKKKKTIDCKLSSYTGHKIDVIGVYDIQIEYNKQIHILPVYIVRGNAPALLGRNWLEKIKLDWNVIIP